MKRIMIFLFAVLCMLQMLTGCSAGYREEHYLGKSSAEIIAAYGEFDCTTMPVGSDGLYRNCRCGYTIRNRNYASAEILYFITFDENGMAVSCEIGYRPGG